MALSLFLSRHIPYKKVSKMGEGNNSNIPEQLQAESFRFIKLKGRTKIPAEKDWQNSNNYDWKSASKFLENEMVGWLADRGIF